METAAKFNAAAKFNFVPQRNLIYPPVLSFGQNTVWYLAWAPQNLTYPPLLRYGGVLSISDDFWGDFPRLQATWYHFSGNFHRYVLSFRLGVPIPDPFLEDAAMAWPKRRAGAVFRVGNTSHVYQPYTNIVALVKGYNSALYCAQTPMVRMCSIRSPCRIGEFHVTPNGTHARHGSSCRKKSRVVDHEKLYNFS